MNGIYVVVLVIGNDIRGVEVSVYVYVSKDGYYRGIVIWEYDCLCNKLVGIIEVFMILVIVGGGMKVLFIVKVLLNLFNVENV